MVCKTRIEFTDLYFELVAPVLKSSLLVETWLNGNGDFPSICNSSYSVKNIQSLDMEGMKFQDSQDHSKWAISDCTGVKDCGLPGVSTGVDKNEEKAAKKPKKAVRSSADSNDGKSWVCIGDINRQESQKKRGGGTMCLSDENVWKEFGKLLLNVEVCK